jgi:hypothetical protein
MSSALALVIGAVMASRATSRVSRAPAIFSITATRLAISKPARNRPSMTTATRGSTKVSSPLSRRANGFMAPWTSPSRACGSPDGEAQERQ